MDQGSFYCPPRTALLPKGPGSLFVAKSSALFSCPAWRDSPRYLTQVSSLNVQDPRPWVTPLILTPPLSGLGNSSLWETLFSRHFPLIRPPADLILRGGIASWTVSSLILYSLLAVTPPSCKWLPTPVTRPYLYWRLPSVLPFPHQTLETWHSPNRIN